MDNEAHFNITRGATFENIVFRGDYGMLTQDSASKSKANVKYCEIDEEDNLLLYNRMNFTDDNKCA